MARTLKVKMLDREGEPMREGALQSLYASDLELEPIRRRSTTVPDGTVEMEVPDGPTALHAFVAVPCFGQVWITADNMGSGYERCNSPLDFVREASASRLADVQRLMASAEVQWSAACTAHADAAGYCLAAALMASGARRSELQMRSLAHGLWAGEIAIVEQSRVRIASRGKREGFRFGCGGFFRSKDQTEVRELFGEVFNFATLPFYLTPLEREEGRPDYSRVDEILAWCEKDGIAAKGHPLWWMHQLGIPPWLEGADWERVQSQCRRVVGRSTARYRGRVTVWDAVNEAHDWANGFDLTQDKEVEITRITCETVRENDPAATVVVNCCWPFNVYAAEGVIHLGPVYEPIMTPLKYLGRLLEAGTDFDAVGVQLYYPGRDMLAVSRALDRFARLGKPIHVTELGTPSAPVTVRPADPYYLQCIRGEWHQPWCEKAQADWVEWFYTLAYSRPEIQAVTWWDFLDPGFIPSGGLLEEDVTPKESYHRLRALVRSCGFRS